MPRRLDPTVAAEWWWEGNVQAAIARHLTATGWEAVQEADTASQERGIDIVAKRGSRRLAIEVKGYPATVYAAGSRAGQQKPTAPTNQARQWFSHALLTALSLRHQPGREVAIGLPDVPRYRSLVGATETSLRLLGIGVILVAEPDRALWLIEPGASRPELDEPSTRPVVSDVDRR